MPKTLRPYSRVYWEALDDPKFANVWDDDQALAAWLRLLVAADMAWPASASLYRGVRTSALSALCSSGLVDMQPSGRYRIHGLDKEREARSRHASSAATARWDDDMPSHPVSIAQGMHEHPVSNAERMPSQDEQSRDKQRRDEHIARETDRHGLPHITSESQTVAEDITGRPILTAGEKQLTEWDRLVEDHGEAKVCEAFRRVAGGKRLTYRQLVWDAVKSLEPFAKPTDIEDARKAGESEDNWERRVDATRKRNADMRRAMGYDA
jgi:hypothetical protein